ncbi:hypothetical protein [Kitasatospora sp. NPDC101183]|uniref:hypothetical protein n=1 Tax=Kitasatospora sp. NPDC101183 TaxID=3364100 RepID=UPI0037FCF867
MDANSPGGKPADEGPPPDKARKPVWKRPWAWLVTVVATALATALGGFLQHLFQSAGTKVLNEFGPDHAPFTAVFRDESCPAVWTHFPSELQKEVVGKTVEEGTAVLAAHGEADGGQTDLTVTLQGRTQSAVVISAVRVVSAGTPGPPPAEVYGTGGCGGGVPIRSFAVDLDTGTPTAVAVPPDGGAGESPRIVDFPYEISTTEPEVFHFLVRTKEGDRTWYLDIEWTSNGSTGSYRLDNAGRPFRTVALNGDSWQLVTLDTDSSGTVTGLSRG